MGPKCARFDKKTLIQILTHQGITVPADIFDAPKRADALIFLDQLVCFVLGFDVGISTKEDLRVFVAEHFLRVPRGTLHPDTPAVQRFPVSRYIPDDGERHVTGVSILMLYRYLQQFGNICGIFDVSLSDLLRPTAERMRLLAYAAADYIQFQETHLPDALQKWEAVERGRAQIESLREETLEYQEAEEQIAKTLAAKEQEINALREQRQQGTDSLTKLGEKWVRVKEECDAVTAMQQEAEDDVAQKNAKIQSLKRDLELLNGQVVESPQRIQATLTVLEDHLSRVDADLSRTTAQIPEIQLRIQLLEVLAARMTEAETMIRMLDADVRKLNAALYEEDNMNQAVYAVNTKQAEVAKELDAILQSFEALKKDDQRSEMSYATARGELEGTIRLVRDRAEADNIQCRTMQEDNRRLRSQLPQVERDAVDAEEKIREVETTVNELLAHMQAKAHRLARKMISDLQSAKALGFPLGQDGSHPFGRVVELLERESHAKQPQVPAETSF